MEILDTACMLQSYIWTSLRWEQSVYILTYMRIHKWIHIEKAACIWYMVHLDNAEGTEKWTKGICW